MALSKYRLGELITQRREKYDGVSFLPIRGVSKDGFIDAKQPDADLSLYNTYYKYDFVFNPARMEINSIALNLEYEQAICSSLYEIFYVSRTDVLLPEYLNIFIKRDEFARRCAFLGYGSAREYCRVYNIADIEISLPPIEIQQKYVAIHKAMQENLSAFESRLDDLKLICDGYIEDLRKKCPSTKIGKYLVISESRNDDKLDVSYVRGLSVSKEIIETKADMSGVSLSNYKTIDPFHFAYVPDTSRRGDKVSLALNDSDNTYLVSSISTVFTTNTEFLLPEFLMMFFRRSEFDRYARFCSWGSARETFDWSEMCDIEIPIPDIKIQQSIVNVFRVYLERQRIADEMREQLKNICPVLIKGSIEEGA